ncbi:MAG: DUF1127 domain-containing protein [Ahrensia sp.]
MGTIDTIIERDQPISFGRHSYATLDQVSLRQWMVLAVAIVLAKLEKRRTRVHLSRLDDHQLRDIGVSRAQADFEICKSLIFYERNKH